MANATPHLLPRGERLLQGTIAELLSDSATEVEVNNPPSVDELPTYFELDPSSDNPETIRVYDVSGNIIYFERGIYNSGVGREHLPNTPYKQKITSRHWKEVVDAVESGYLLEDSSLTITRDGDNQFTVEGVDRTAFYTLGRILRINGSDASTVVVLSSLLSGSDTKVTIDSAYTLPTPINTVELAIFARGAMDELVLKGATQTLTNKTLTSPVLNTGVSGTAVLDDDTFATASATTIPTSESVKAYVDASAVNFGLYQNAIMNGNFDIAQRGTSFTASSNNDDVYTLDRWNLISDGNDVLDVSQEAITDLPGSNYAIKLDVETAKRAGIVQFIEAKDAKKLKGKTVSLSFAVKSANISAIRATVLSWSSTADSLTSDVVGTWAATPTWATNWAANATPADLTVTSSWTTVKVENIAIDETTVNNLALVIWLPNEETIGDIVYISQVQMNEGAVALPFQPKSFEEELRACQRYYQRAISSGGTLPGVLGMTWSTAGSVQVTYPLSTPLRAAPSFTSGYIRMLRMPATGDVNQVEDVGTTAPASVTYVNLNSNNVLVTWTGRNATKCPAYTAIAVWGDAVFDAEL